jgi:hypothetical protein
LSAQLPSVRTSLKATVGAGSQLSVAVTVAGGGTLSLHDKASGPGTPTSIGACMSCTVITCVALLLFPQWSVAVQVRVRV